MEKRVISTQLQEEDYKIESSLRPQRLEDYIGQEKIKSNMKGVFGPCTVLWTTGTWKDNACRDHCKRDGYPPESDLGTCNCKTGRDGGDPE